MPCAIMPCLVATLEQTAAKEPEATPLELPGSEPHVFRTVDGLGHSYNPARYGAAGKAADRKTMEDVASFLTRLGLLPEPDSGAE